MNRPCHYAKTCTDRMAHGDMPQGCNSNDEKRCFAARHHRAIAQTQFAQIKVDTTLAGPFDALLKVVG